MCSNDRAFVPHEGESVMIRGPEDSESFLAKVTGVTENPNYPGSLTHTRIGFERTDGGSGSECLLLWIEDIPEASAERFAAFHAYRSGVANEPENDPAWEEAGIVPLKAAA